MDKQAKRAVYRLIIYKAKHPNRVIKAAVTIAALSEILPLGKGRFFVLLIKASKSFSIH